MASDDLGGGAGGAGSKVVKLKLRYKSATVDEFIARYGRDVSPRGMYVNIAKTLAVGTLVKLEILLASEQAAIKGAGRVVVNRDRAQVSAGQLAGLWIEFIQIDAASKELIAKLVGARADAGVAYDENVERDAEGDGEDATVVGSVPTFPEETPAPPAPAAPPRKTTLMGVTAPPALPARPRLPSLPLPLPPAPPPMTPPPPSVLPVSAPPRIKATLMGITAPSTLPLRAGASALPPLPLPPAAKGRSVPPPAARASEALPPARPRMPSLPPLPLPPPPKAPPAASYAVSFEDEDRDEETSIWDHEQSLQGAQASPVPAALPRQPAMTGVAALATLARRTGASASPPVPGGHEPSTDAPRTPPAPGDSPHAAAAREEAARVARLKATVMKRRSPALPPLESPEASEAVPSQTPPAAAGAQEASSGRGWGWTVVSVALGFFAVVAVGLAIRSTQWFRGATTSPLAPGVAVGGAPSATATSVEAPSSAAPVTSAESAPVPAARAVAASVEAGPAARPPVATKPAWVAPPATGASPPAIAVPVAPVAAPAPKPAPVIRAVSPAATAQPKPKPKPAPTIDDGF